MGSSGPFGPLWFWMCMAVFLCVLCFYFIRVDMSEARELAEASTEDLIVVSVLDKTVESQDGKAKFTLQLRRHDKSSLAEVEVSKELYNSIEKDDRVQYEITENSEFIVKKN